MTPVYSHYTEEKALSSIMRDLRIFAKRENVIVITATQAHEKSAERRGFRRLFGASVGKAGNPDIIILVDSAFNNTYRLNIVKARGRDTAATEQTKDVILNWDKMEINPA